MEKILNRIITFVIVLALIGTGIGAILYEHNKPAGVFPMKQHTPTQKELNDAIWLQNFITTIVIIGS